MGFYWIPQVSAFQEGKIYLPSHMSSPYPCYLKKKSFISEETAVQYYMLVFSALIYKFKKNIIST